MRARRAARRGDPSGLRGDDRQGYSDKSQSPWTGGMQQAGYGSYGPPKQMAANQNTQGAFDSLGLGGYNASGHPQYQQYGQSGGNQGYNAYQPQGGGGGMYGGNNMYGGGGQSMFQQQGYADQGAMYNSMAAEAGMPQQQGGYGQMTPQGGGTYAESLGYTPPGSGNYNQSQQQSAAPQQQGFQAANSDLWAQNMGGSSAYGNQTTPQATQAMKDQPFVVAT